MRQVAAGGSVPVTVSAFCRVTDTVRRPGLGRRRRHDLQRAGPFDPNSFNAQNIAEQARQAVDTHQGSKVNYVLVDTVGPRADQISQVKDLVRRYEPYAFFLG